MFPSGSLTVNCRSPPFFPEDPRCSRLTTSVPGTTRRYLLQTPSERQVQTAASSSEKISAPYHRVTRPQFLCLGKAIRSQSRVHLCNAVVRVRHQRPATPALAGQLRSFSLLRPQRSPLCSKPPTRQIRTLPQPALTGERRGGIIRGDCAWSGTGRNKNSKARGPAACQ